ncbi:putative holin-like toxin [Lacticaseibacillus zeae]|uniref:Putative holin-like toxin n=1 Tax=Lacticaseibacillus zeae TaxID=57037 RepID=A0A5R8LQV1_LACZE|nr:putative holin-like toxin [Lacticaseibacillus zeae]
MIKIYTEGGVSLSVADALMLMLTFAMFTLALAAFIIDVVKAILGNQKDRQ